MERGRLTDETKYARSDDHSGQKFTENGRLPHARHDFAEQLRSQPDDDEAQQHFPKVHRALPSTPAVDRSPSARDIGPSTAAIDPALGAALPSSLSRSQLNTRAASKEEGDAFDGEPPRIEAAAVRLIKILSPLLKVSLQCAPGWEW